MHHEWALCSTNMSSLVVVKLYYPTQWRQNIGDLACSEDKRFNWFLCSKRYEEHGDLIAEVSAGTKFYEESTGTNYILGESAKLLIVDRSGHTSRGHGNESSKNLGSYQGAVSLIECKNPSESIICPEAIFGFVKGVLKIDKSTPSGCPIIQYAKTNYKCIRTHIPNFPSPFEIDSMIKKRPLGTVCKILYDNITKYIHSIDDR